MCVLSVMKGELILSSLCRQVESSEDAYMTLDPKSRCSEYDTLDVSYSAVVVKVTHEILFVMHMFTSSLEDEEIL